MLTITATKMDTATMAVSSRVLIRAGEYAAAEKEQQSKDLQVAENCAVMFMYLPLNLKLLYPTGGHLSTCEITKISCGVYTVFCAGCTTNQDLSISALHAGSTLLRIGTQVELP